MKWNQSGTLPSPEVLPAGVWGSCKTSAVIGLRWCGLLGSLVSVPPSAAPRGALPVGARSPPPGSVTPRLAPGCTEPRPRAGGSPRAEPRSSECDARLTTIDGVEDEERKPLMRCEALEAAAAGARAACGQRLGAAAAASVRPAERERGAARRGAGCAAPPPRRKAAAAPAARRGTKAGLLVALLATPQASWRPR